MLKFFKKKKKEKVVENKTKEVVKGIEKAVKKNKIEVWRNWK